MPKPAVDPRAGLWPQQLLAEAVDPSRSMSTDFCCPDYLAQLVTLIQRSWDQNQGVVGSTTMKFTIARDGTIQAPQVEKPSGFIALDNSAMRAVQITRLPPLPAAFQNPTLTVHMRFDYQR